MKHVFSFVAILTSMIQYDLIKTLTMVVIWFSNNSVKKSSRTGRDKKNMMPAFACLIFDHC